MFLVATFANSLRPLRETECHYLSEFFEKKLDTRNDA